MTRKRANDLMAFCVGVACLLPAVFDVGCCDAAADRRKAGQGERPPEGSMVLSPLEIQLVDLEWPKYIEDGFGPEDPGKAALAEYERLVERMRSHWGWIEPEVSLKKQPPFSIEWEDDGEMQDLVGWAERVLEQRRWSEAYRESMRWYDSLYARSAVRFVRLEAMSDSTWSLPVWAVDLGPRTVVLTSRGHPDELPPRTRYRLGVASSQQMKPWFAKWSLAASDVSPSDVYTEGASADRGITWYILTVYKYGQYRHRIWAEPVFYSFSHAPESRAAAVYADFVRQNPHFAQALAGLDSESTLLGNGRVRWLGFDGVGDE